MLGGIGEWDVRSSGTALYNVSGHRLHIIVSNNEHTDLSNWS